MKTTLLLSLAAATVLAAASYADASCTTFRCLSSIRDPDKLDYVSNKC